MNPEWLETLWRTWLAPGASAAVVLAVAVVGWRIGVVLLRRLTRHRPVAALFLESARAPGLAVVALIALQAVMQPAPDRLYGIELVRHASTLALIAAATWLSVRMMSTVADAVAALYPVGVAENLEARRIHTQARLLTRTASSVVVLVGVSFALLTFPGVRHIGASLLASAGIAGLVVGIAARPILGNLLAGLQIALTQPIRIDDVVIVEGEWGRIEDIGRTFVTIALWDQRRLVVPLQYFVEKPFQNWTRASSEILGTVFLWVDYGMPVEPLRAELRRICEAAPEWDRRVCLVQVTDASDRAMQLRALVSAADAGRAWDLRCLVRERLIDFIRREHAQFLPRLRADFTPTPDAGGDTTRAARPSPVPGRAPASAEDSSPPG
jgi:small-conductance mechanosensitive channel